MRASSPSRTNRPGCGPESDRRVAYQGATGEKLHSKWVTFHEGQPLSM